jgi:hypothetical protein
MTLVPPRRVVRRFAAAAPPASGCWSGAGVAAKRSRWRQRRERSDGRQAGLRARVDDLPSRPCLSPGEGGSGAPQVSVRRRIRSLRRRVRDGYISLSAHGHARPRLAHRELRARGIRDPGGRLLLTGDRSPGLSSIERRETHSRDVVGGLDGHGSAPVVVDDLDVVPVRVEHERPGGRPRARPARRGPCSRPQARRRGTRAPPRPRAHAARGTPRPARST